MAIVGRAKYTHARAPFGSRLFEISQARVCVFRPAIAIAKIRDYLQSIGREKNVTVREIQLPRGNMMRQPTFARVRVFVHGLDGF